MLVSRSHGFHYIKSCKVGGTTIECVLGQLCQGPEDIFTKFRLTEDTDKKYRQGNITKKYIDPEDITEHINYEELSEKIDLSDLRPIISIRHPYEICVSECQWASIGIEEYNKTGKVEIKSDVYIREIFDKLIIPDRIHKFRLYQFHGKSLYHPKLFTIRFTHLQEDLKTLCEEYNINSFIPHTKKTRSIKAYEVPKILSKEQLRIIHFLFKKDFDHWGWEKYV